MPELTIISRDCDEHRIDGEVGTSLMKTIRNDGLDELLGLCGGCCSCATCHVYVEPDYGDALPEISEDENDLLESSDHRRPASHLSCQIMLSDNLDALRVTIASED